MTDIVIVGKAYYGDRGPDQGLPPGSPGSPSHPWVPPSPGSPSHPWVPPGNYPDQGLPGIPPGFWGGVAPPYPDQGLPPGSPGSPAHPIYNPAYPAHPIYNPLPYPDQGLPQPPQGSGTPVPEDVYTPAPIPEEIASQYVVSVYDPKTTNWTTKSYPPR